MFPFRLAAWSRDSRGKRKGKAASDKGRERGSLGRHEWVSDVGHGTACISKEERRRGKGPLALLERSSLEGQLDARASERARDAARPRASCIIWTRPAAAQFRQAIINSATVTGWIQTDSLFSPPCFALRLKTDYVYDSACSITAFIYSGREVYCFTERWYLFFFFSFFLSIKFLKYTVNRGDEKRLCIILAK